MENVRRGQQRGVQLSADFMAAYGRNLFPSRRCRQRVGSLLIIRSSFANRSTKERNETSAKLDAGKTWNRCAHNFRPNHPPLYPRVLQRLAPYRAPVAIPSADKNCNDRTSDSWVTRVCIDFIFKDEQSVIVFNPLPYNIAASISSRSEWM